jgi:excisionase family DNA binding protein
MAANQQGIPVKQFYKVSEVARLFDVTDRTVREWLKSGQLHGVKPGDGNWRIPVEAIQEYTKIKYNLHDGNKDG